MKISVIIPIFNEEKYIEKCITSLISQTLEHEILAVDDGSTDDSMKKIVHLTKKHNLKTLHILHQSHIGPGAARNLGAKNAQGDILVFIDADMIFENDFLYSLTKPILDGETKGTFSKNEKVANWNNIWAKTWNYNQNLPTDRLISIDYPNHAPVFRAILKSEFIRIGGFSPSIGWTDDWTLSEKLGYQATATNAAYYHQNPSNITEIFIQAKWIGKNINFTGNLLRYLYNLLKHNFIISLITGFYKSVKYKCCEFIIFKIVYDFGILAGMLNMLFSTNRYK